MTMENITKTNSQKQEPIIKPSVTTSATFNPSYVRSLKVLSMSNEQLFSHFRKVINHNPFIEYLPHKVYKDNQLTVFDYMQQEKTLQDDLLFQLETYRGTYSKKICTFIINSLDEHGFLLYSIDEYCSFLKVETPEFLNNLKIIQSFEPTGIACANSIESIKLQLLQDNQIFAYHLFSNYQNEIIHKQFNTIALECNTTVEEVMETLLIIKDMNPYPASSYQSKTFNYVYPDITIEIDNADILIKQNDYGSISYTKDYYKDIHNDPVLKQYFKDASILIADINKRNATLLLICNELVNIQKDYLIYGKSLKRCTIAELSIKLGMHSSTISRTINNKYFEINQQIFPLNSLLMGKKTKDLTDPIQKAIQLIVAKEHPSFPYSDYEIGMLLKKQNINISRRTINKYRKIMGIENSYKRRKDYSQ